MDELIQLLTYLEETPRGNYKRSIQYLALFTLIARTGLHVGEALALEWEDIDLDAGTVCVNKTLSFGSKLELNVTKPKTKKANRTLRTDAQTNELMRRHRTSQKEVYLAYPNYKKPELPSCSIVLMGRGCGQASLGIIYETPGVQHISPHVLRHTHAVHLLEAGADVKYVADRLGHADTKITMNIYLHVSKKIEHDAMELYEMRLNQTSTTQKSADGSRWPAGAFGVSRVPFPSSVGQLWGLAEGWGVF